MGRLADEADVCCGTAGCRVLVVGKKISATLSLWPTKTTSSAEANGTFVSVEWRIGSVQPQGILRWATRRKTLPVLFVLEGEELRVEGGKRVGGKKRETDEIGGKLSVEGSRVSHLASGPELTAWERLASM